MATQILIIEKNKAFAQLLQKELMSIHYEVHHLSSYSSKIDLKPYSVMIIDDSFFDPVNIDTFQLIKKENPQIYLLLLSRKTDDLDIITALEQGVDVAINKPCSTKQIRIRIQNYLKKRIQQQNQNETISYSGIKLDLSKHEAYSKTKLIHLTYKEFQILHWFMHHKNLILTREQLLHQFWDYGHDQRAVDIHIFKLREKLQDKGKIIETIRGVGYRFNETKISNDHPLN